jgi:hypothetical protein
MWSNAWPGNAAPRPLFRLHESPPRPSPAEGRVGRAACRYIHHTSRTTREAGHFDPMRKPTSVLFLATALAAQTQPNIVWYPDNIPSGTANAFPWGSEGVRYQCIFTNAMLGNTPASIRDVFVLGDAMLGDSEVVYGDIEIRMGTTPQPSLVPTWSLNNPNPTTVHRGPLRVRFRVGQWSGIGLPRSFLWLPLSANDHLCFEVIVWSVKDRGKAISPAPSFMYTPTGTGGRAFLYQWVQGGGFSNPTAPGYSVTSGAKIGLLLDDGNVVTLGSGCTSSLSTPLAIGGDPGKWPQQANTFNVNLAGAAALAPAFLALGVREDRWNGLPLPLDLGPIGAPACRVYHEFVAALPYATDASGNSKYALALPANAAGFQVKATWVVLDAAANPSGFTTSDYATLILGR